MDVTDSIYTTLPNLHPLVLGADGLAYDECNNGTPATDIPVGFLSFSAGLKNSQVLLNWKVTHEENASHFTVQKGGSLTSFTNLHVVNAYNNGKATNTYSMTDDQPLPGVSYYRLEETDNDGKMVYSAVASVTISNAATLFVAPNPVVNVVNVSLISNAAGSASVQVIDGQGHIRIVQNKELIQGRNAISIPASSLGKGVYILRILQSDYTTQSMKFIKQ